jgi:hypothetical protein
MSKGSGGGGRPGRSGGGSTNGDAGQPGEVVREANMANRGSPTTWSKDEIVDKLVEQGHQQFLKNVDRTKLKQTIKEEFSRETDKKLYHELNAASSNPNYKAAVKEFDKISSKLRLEHYMNPKKIW